MEPTAFTHNKSASSECNTTELSDLTGLSKILRADDSIADRVRCLLEDDEAPEPNQKPELLNSANRNNPSVGELKDEVASLLCEREETGKPRTSSPETSDLGDESRREIDENVELKDIEIDKEERAVEESDTPSFTISGRRSGDGADFVPTPTTTQQDLHDDIMNISDSTEYSDLPKIIDNPMKNSRTELRSASQQPTIEEDRKEAIEFSPSIIAEPSSSMVRAVKFPSGSDPNPSRFVEDFHEEDRLDKRTGRNMIPVPKKLDAANPVDTLVKKPFHLPPGNNSKRGADSNPGVSMSHSFNSESLDSVYGRRSQIGNITVRSREPDTNASMSKSTSSPARSLKSLQNQTLGDEELMAKVRKAVNENKGTSGELKGPHTASENSIASTVDSLALQVRNLLKEEDFSQKFSPSGVSGINVNEVSLNSNYSEEINNFEKTSLWKYTRQFLPGAMTPSREIQPLTKFSDPSPAQDREQLTDSTTSNSSSPETYRLARQSFSPLGSHSNDRWQPRRNKVSDYSEQLEKHALSSTVQDTSMSRDRTSHSLTTPYHNYSSKQESSSGKLQSRIIGRYDSHPHQTNFTPQNESYKVLEPEYSQTPYTPYTFVTPRKVAWEPERDTPVIKYKSPVSLENATRHSVAHTLPPRSPVHERSAYFSEKPVDRVHRSPKVPERSASIRFQRLTPDFTDSVRKHHAEQRDKFTSTKDFVTNTSDDQIFVKPVTPPSRHQSARQDLTLQDRLNLTKSFPPQPEKSTPRFVSLSPKSVHFREFASKLPSQDTPFGGSRSPINPDYSLTTPLVSSRPPKRNITPKINKEKPRPSRSLPTYDQLVAEQEKEHEELKKDLKEPLLKTSSHQEKRKKTEEPPKILDLHVADGDFLNLEPEVCLDESDQEEDPLTPHGKSNGGSRTLSLSDSDLHRRTTQSGDSCISDCSTSPVLNTPGNAIVTKVSEHGSSSDVVEKAAFQGSNSPPCTPTEPAPLPYVRLCKKKPTMPLKTKTPPRPSISTEKVQNLLMKEKSVGRQPVRSKNVSVSARFPTANGVGYASTDDELVSLLETFSMKVPLMEKLLKKLHGRNVEKQSILLSDNDDHVVVSQHRKVNQAVQTSEKVTVSPTRVQGKTKSPKCRNQSQRKLFTENSCQTSFLRPSSKPLFVNTSSSPMQDNSDELETESVEEVGKSDSMYFSKHPTEDKENSYSKSRIPCAFFVDLTPEKLPREPPELSKPSQLPVAWFEPYEYLPPWKTKEDNPRITLGFVDANIQDAFLNNKRKFVLRSWERQEDIALRAEERKLRDLEERIHDQIAALHKEKADAAAKSSQKPFEPKTKDKKNRVFGWKEMRIASKQKYEDLPEVVAKRKEAERKKYYELNRKRAHVYKRKIARSVVEKQKGKLTSRVR